MRSADVGYGIRDNNWGVWVLPPPLHPFRAVDCLHPCPITLRQGSNSSTDTAVAYRLWFPGWPQKCHWTGVCSYHHSFIPSFIPSFVHSCSHLFLAFVSLCTDTYKVSKGRVPLSMSGINDAVTQRSVSRTGMSLTDNEASSMWITRNTCYLIYKYNTILLRYIHAANQPTT